MSPSFYRVWPLFHYKFSLRYKRSPSFLQGLCSFHFHHVSEVDLFGGISLENEVNTETFLRHVPKCSDKWLFLKS